MIDLKMKNILSLTLLLLASSSVAKTEDAILIIDVRTPTEWDRGHLPNAKHIEWQNIGEEITKLTNDKHSTIYVYCRSGNRSGKAKLILEQLGYSNVINAGGMNEAQLFIDSKT
jgi:phage shock protein E